MLLVVPKDELHLYYDKNVDLPVKKEETCHFSSGIKVKEELFSSEVKEKKICMSKIDQNGESSSKKKEMKDLLRVKEN